MPVIQAINATNASFVLQYGRYTDFNLWLAIFVASILLIFASRLLPAKDDVGKLIVGMLAFIFAIAAVWGSLGIAYFGYANGVDSAFSNLSTNETITYQYIYPTQQVVATPWITFVCIAVVVFTILNMIDYFLIMMQRPSEEDKKKGRGIKI